MTSRFPNTVMTMMMQRKTVRTVVSSEFSDSCGCSCCCCPVFVSSSNKLRDSRDQKQLADCA